MPGEKQKSVSLSSRFFSFLCLLMVSVVRMTSGVHGKKDISLCIMHSAFCISFGLSLSRNLNHRLSPLERARCSFRLTRSGRFCLRQMTHWVTVPLVLPQPQSSPLALGAGSMLVSVDSFESLLPSANDPLGHRSSRSPNAIMLPRLRSFFASMLP